jgi:hypothetical protein
VSRVLNLWNESRVTWSTQPGVALTGTQISPAMEGDVTADVPAFYSGTTNHGWRISDQTENSWFPHVQNWINTYYDDDLVGEIIFDENLMGTVSHLYEEAKQISPLWFVGFAREEVEIALAAPSHIWSEQSGF